MDDSILTTGSENRLLFLARVKAERLKARPTPRKELAEELVIR
jgi:hypothetical protein